MIVLQAIQPSYGWLFGSRLLGVYDAYRRHNQSALFAELKQRAGGQRCVEHATEALNVLTRMSIVSGKDLLAFDLEDLTDYARACRDNGRTVTALPLAYDILHAIGGLKDSPPTRRPLHLRRALGRHQAALAAGRRRPRTGGPRRTRRRLRAGDGRLRSSAVAALPGSPPVPAPATDHTSPALNRPKQLPALR
ncbi:hypothetical protein [Streptomyces sp. NPDC127072]|uniref:hypothetical protein n=1 Tax=Streptomyces sp. NPDC127072 TaxID=3347129 RepID=UPI00364E8208